MFILIEDDWKWTKLYSSYSSFMVVFCVFVCLCCVSPKTLCVPKNAVSSALKNLSKNLGGEASQILSGGALVATPHQVRSHERKQGERPICRETFAPRFLEFLGRDEPTANNTGNLFQEKAPKGFVCFLVKNNFKGWFLCFFLWRKWRWICWDIFLTLFFFIQEAFRNQRRKLGTKLETWKNLNPKWSEKLEATVVSTT